MSDRGYTLIEAVISIALMAIIVIPITLSLRTAVQASLRARSASQVESALINAADRVNRAPQACDYTQYAQAAVQTQGWPADRATTATQWFDPTSGVWATDGRGCRFDAVTSDLIQRVRIVVTSLDGSVTRSVEVVKSRV